MDIKTKKRLFNLSETIKNSKEKIDKYQKQLKIETDYTKKSKLELKIEIEKLRIIMKQKEGKLIMLNNK